MEIFFRLLAESIGGIQSLFFGGGSLGFIQQKENGVIRQGFIFYHRGFFVVFLGHDFSWACGTALDDCGCSAYDDTGDAGIGTEP
ncbi:hypothetical protein SDC9_54421 [bioreactor metagenome]|uniref:Uncharacterized protein n=1 Tax=bioreactor metagenome TaxID=1076179 RepID=A0A644WWE2_9ZZZZ